MPHYGRTITISSALTGFKHFAEKLLQTAKAKEIEIVNIQKKGGMWSARSTNKSK